MNIPGLGGSLPGLFERADGCRRRLRDADLAAALLADGDDGGARRHIRLEVRPARRRVLEGRLAAEGLPVLDAVGCGVLDGDEDGLVVGCEARPAQLRTHRALKEELREPALFAFDLEGIEAIELVGLSRPR